MKIECAYNHSGYQLSIDKKEPDNMLDVPLQNIADAISGYRFRGDNNV